MEQAVDPIPTWAVVSTVTALVSAIVAMGLFIRWLVVKIIAEMRASTAAIISFRGSVDKLAKAVEHLGAAIEKEHTGTRRR